MIRDASEIVELIGKRPQHVNCHGATLWFTHQTNELDGVEPGDMIYFIETETTPVKGLPCIGDIVTFWQDFIPSLEGRLLQHTAVYIGEGKFFHKGDYHRAFGIYTLNEIYRDKTLRCSYHEFVRPKGVNKWSM